MKKIPGFWNVSVQLLLLFCSFLVVGCNLTGQITDQGGGVSGVTVRLVEKFSGSPIGTRTTGPDGTYAFNDLNRGIYTVTPSLDGYDFSPISPDVTIINADVIQNFTAVPLYNVTGQITDTAPVPDVTVNLSGGISRSTKTDEFGMYSFEGLRSDDTYTITPSKRGYVFTPVSKTSPFDDLNFGAQKLLSISGNITLPDGSLNYYPINLYRSGALLYTTTTDNTGYYEFTELVNGHYSVSPSAGEYQFDIDSISIGLNGSDAANQNFRAVTPPELQVLIPSYIYHAGEGETAWSAIANAKDRVVITAIINPNDGPCRSDGDPCLHQNDRDAMKKLYDEGVKMVGYVATNFGDRPKEDVEADIRKYVDEYYVDEKKLVNGKWVVTGKKISNIISGIFLDQVDNNDGTEETKKHYEGLYKYIHDTVDGKEGENGFPFDTVILNAGARIHPDYLNYAETIVIYEGYSPGWTNYTNEYLFDYAADKFSMIVHSEEDPDAMK